MVTGPTGAAFLCCFHHGWGPAVSWIPHAFAQAPWLSPRGSHGGASWVTLCWWLVCHHDTASTLGPHVVEAPLSGLRASVLLLAQWHRSPVPVPCLSHLPLFSVSFLIFCRLTGLFCKLIFSHSVTLEVTPCFHSFSSCPKNDCVCAGDVPVCHLPPGPGPSVTVAPAWPFCSHVCPHLHVTLCSPLCFSFHGDVTYREASPPHWAQRGRGRRNGWSPVGHAAPGARGAILSSWPHGVLWAPHRLWQE